MGFLKRGELNRVKQNYYNVSKIMKTTLLTRITYSSILKPNIFNFLNLFLLKCHTTFKIYRRRKALQLSNEKQIKKYNIH